MSKSTKKLIETVIPLTEINDASAYDKMPGIGAHPKGIHHWWARLPLPCARAVLFASVVDDPCSVDGFDDLPEAEQAKLIDEREYLHNLIIRLIDKKPHEHPEVFKEARQVIDKACDGRMPEVLDPFTGGGSIPLEAQRLGFQAHGRDLNPVPALITKATIDYPARFADHPPVNPKSPKNRKWQRAQGLAEDVRYYGHWMLEEARKRIGHLYPKVELPPEHGGGEADVIAWIWARTVKSPNPAFSHVDVPLVRSFVLSTKKGKRAYVEAELSDDDYSFKVIRGEGKPAISGTVDRSGGRCIMSGAPIPFSYIRKEGKSGRIGTRLLAVVANGPKGRVYLDASPSQETIAKSETAELTPQTPIPEQALGFRVQLYGMLTHGQLFSQRQLLSMVTFADLIKEAVNQTKADGASDKKSEAIATYLACALDRMADFNCTLSTWKPSGEQQMHLFTRQAIPMVWDFCEANFLGNKAICWSNSIKYVSDGIETSLITFENLIGEIKQQDAAETKWHDKSLIISTDPPYYDNIGYADLSDFFYVWLRRSLREIHTELLGTLLTPKAQELIASPYRQGDREKAKEHFESGFRHAFSGMKHAIDPRFPLTVYYAMKQTESESEVGSGNGRNTGWETLLESLVQSGFHITATWPVRASQKWRMVSMGTNALASYVVLACRLRAEDAPTGTRVDFLRELDRELPPALKELQAQGIPAVDLAQSILGPAMGIYSRYAKIVEADGSRMPVSTALDLINQRLGEQLSGIESELDRDSRWAVAWFESFGHTAADAGEADGLCRSKGVSLQGLREAGIIYAGGGKVRLLQRVELDDDWSPESDGRLTDWEICQQMIRTQEAKGNEGLARLIKKCGTRAENGRALAYRLFDVCERKGWAKEATPYNVLVTGWGDAHRLSSEVFEFGD